VVDGAAGTEHAADDRADHLTADIKRQVGGGGFLQ
jgi:hypothetical protein